MLAAVVLDPQPGEEVLDLAAAPGGKTLHMAARMHNQGRIGAVEAIRERFFKLRKLLDVYGATMVQTYLADGRTIGRKTPERFDRVLLDAPCSCEARFDPREPDSWRYWSPRKIKESARKQKGLLRSAADCLKPGGSLLYCTCTFAPEENELIVASLLEEQGDALEVVPITCPLPNVQPGLVEWEGRSLRADLARSLRILPNAWMDAAYLCKLVKHRGWAQCPGQGRTSTRDYRNRNHR
jgi:16S rRNA (cytosine1407-C5)-methyltransferase